MAPGEVQKGDLHHLEWRPANGGGTPLKTIHHSHEDRDSYGQPDRQPLFLFQFALFVLFSLLLLFLAGHSDTSAIALL